MEISKDYTYAIIGASNNTGKYGHRVLKDLKAAGFKVVPINPNEKEILGLKVYPTVADYQDKIDVAVFIVPPQVTEKVLKEVKEVGIDKVWMQPGADSEAAIKYCKDNNLDCVTEDCIMIEKLGEGHGH